MHQSSFLDCFLHILTKSPFLDYLSTVWILTKSVVGQTQLLCISFFGGTNQFFYDKVGLIHVVYTNRLRFLVGSTQIRIIFPPSMYTNRILFPPSTKLSNFELMLGQTILRMNLESFVFVDGCR